MSITIERKILDGAAVREIVRRWAKAAGIATPMGPHTLRRSCATEMIRRGANPGHVKDILGHADFVSIDAYVRLAVVDLKETLRKYHPRERGDDGNTSMTENGWLSPEDVVNYGGKEVNMTKKEQLISEIERVPERILDEVLDFVLFLNERKAGRRNDIAIVAESSLKKDWLTPQEDEAWRDL